jgi:hypothetical protein
MWSPGDPWLAVAFGYPWRRPSRWVLMEWRLTSAVGHHGIYRDSIIREEGTHCGWLWFGLCRIFYFILIQGHYFHTFYKGYNRHLMCLQSKLTKNYNGSAKGANNLRN